VTPAPPLCLDLKSAAASLGISVWVLRRYIEDKLIPTVKFPSAKNAGEQSRRVLIKVADLEAFVNKHRENVTADAHAQAVRDRIAR
jgi:predicted site-specific integrase-resolvase